jgi:hypothetical protein
MGQGQLYGFRGRREHRRSHVERICCRSFSVLAFYPRAHVCSDDPVQWPVALSTDEDGTIGRDPRMAVGICAKAR